MNLLLLTLSLASMAGHLCLGAPAVTSVHVSFVSGNKKTQYSHGTSTGPAVVHYALDAAGSGDELRNLARRSISQGPQSEPGGGARRTRRRYRGGQVGGQSTSGTLFASPTDSSGYLASGSTLTSEHPTPTSSTRRTSSGTTTTSTTAKTKRRYRGPSPLTFRTTTGHATDSPTNIYTSTKRQNNPSIITSTSQTSSTPYDTSKRNSYDGATRSTSGQEPSTTHLPLKRLRSRVRFVGSPASTLSSASSGGGRGGDVVVASPAGGVGVGGISSTMSTGSLLDDMSTTADITKAENKPKDSKAVKRSPYIENFESRGITFPDFDEFGGNEFGALRNFIGGSGGGGGGGGSSNVAAHSHANPESLSPDGVFLPPLPTEASDYAEDSHGGGGGDPYIADAETAKYAAQHPPFFAAFPHKRTVLDLNERRVEQGLEPNILRSIRPFFAFFDAAK